MPRLEFWYDFASTYSYLSAMRIERLAAAASVELVWRPFLLGPIFKAQGWTSSPFNIYPAKGRHMVRDLERTAADRGLPFAMPAAFPAGSLLACRVAMAGERDGWTPEFTKAVYQAEFAQSLDIADPEVLSQIVRDLGADPASILATARSDEIKAALRARTDEAVAKGIFGAPSFVTPAGELFWGDDRLEQAFAWTIHSSISQKSTEYPPNGPANSK